MNRWIFGEKYPTHNNNFWYQRSLAKNSQNVSIGKQIGIQTNKDYISFDNPFPSPTTHTAAGQPRGKREREEEMTKLERNIQERAEKLQKLRAKKVLQSKMQENDEHALEGNNY